MIWTHVAELFDASRLQRDRLDQVLATATQGPPAAWNMPQAGWTLRTLREFLIQVIPQALDVGVPQCILYRWLPTQAAAATADLSVALNLEPQVDLYLDGLIQRTLVLRATLALYQRNSGWHRLPDGSIDFGAARAWDASLSLRLGEPGIEPTMDPFYTHRATVHLPPGPWVPKR